MEEVFFSKSKLRSNMHAYVLHSYPKGFCQHTL